MRRSSDRGEIQIGETHVRVRLPEETSICVAEILGWISRVPGKEHVVLDRVVHRREDDEVGGWRVSGAVATEIMRGEA